MFRMVYKIDDDMTAAVNESNSKTDQVKQARQAGGIAGAGEKLKILFLDQHYAIPDGMTIPRSYILTRHLVRGNHHITVISGVNRKSGFTRDKKSKFIEDQVFADIRLIRIGIPYNHFMSAFKRLLSFAGFMVVSCFKAFFHKKPDIVFATSTPLTIGVPALLVSKLKRVPFVFEVRDLWPEFAIDIGALKNPVLIKIATILEKMCYRNAVKILTISEGLRQRMIERGISGEKIETIPIGVDLESVNAIPPDTSFRETHGLNGKFVAVYGGTHGPSNGLNIVVEAARLLKDQPDIVLVMIGEGKEKKNLMAKKEEYGLDNLLFIDAMPRNRLLSILKEVDAGLMITINLIRSMLKCPNLPRKFFDYLACGLPVLVNVEGDMSDIIQEKQIGLVCSETDPEGLAKNILTLYSESDTRQSMAENAARLVRDYDLSRISHVFEKKLLEAFHAKQKSLKGKATGGPIEKNP